MGGKSSSSATVGSSSEKTQRDSSGCMAPLFIQKRNLGSSVSHTVTHTGIKGSMQHLWRDEVCSVSRALAPFTGPTQQAVHDGMDGTDLRNKKKTIRTEREKADNTGNFPPKKGLHQEKQWQEKYIIKTVKELPEVLEGAKVSAAVILSEP